MAGSAPMNELEDKMAAARGRWTSEVLKGWYSPARLHAALTSAAAPEAGRVGDLEFGATFRDNVATVDVPDPAAWANRRLNLGGDHWCVTGIRYRGLDVTKPFVDVVATSLPATADALADLAEQVLPHYEQFAPRAVRVDAPDPDDLTMQVAAHPALTEADVDQYTVAGLVHDLSALPARPGFDRIALVPVEVDEAVQAAEECYAQVGENRPDLPLWARPSLPEELGESHEQGLLFRIHVDGAPAGVVASRRDDDHAMTGFVVQEIVLDRNHLGQRLAAPVQQHLVRVLPAQDGDTLWGSIHPANEPSLRNALSLGRRIVGAYVWLTPTGLPGL